MVKVIRKVVHTNSRKAREQPPRVSLARPKAMALLQKVTVRVVIRTKTELTVAQRTNPAVVQRCPVLF